MTEKDNVTATCHKVPFFFLCKRFSQIVCTMPAKESNAKTDKRASSQTSGSAVNVPIAKKRKLTPAEALIKSMTARKAIASQKKPSGSHVTFGDNDEVIEKKPATEKEDQKKNKKKKAKKTTSDAAGSMVSTASLFQGGSTGSILPNNPGTEQK